MLVLVCDRSLTEVFTNSYGTLFIGKVVILVLDSYFMLVTALIATFVLLFPLIDPQKLFHKLPLHIRDLVYLDGRVRFGSRFEGYF